MGDGSSTSHGGSASIFDLRDGFLSWRVPTELGPRGRATIRNLFYVGVAVLVAAIALTYAQLPPRTVGRYVVAQANGDFANVVWVLDTLTGEVAAHQLARSENAQGEFAG